MKKSRTKSNGKPSGASPKPFPFTLKDGRVVTIRRFGPKESAKAFQKYINDLVRSKAQIIVDRLLTFAEQQGYVKSTWKSDQSGSTRHWIAVAPDGQIAANFESSVGRYRERDKASIGVSVHPAFQGQGLGEKMLRTVVADALAAYKPRLVFLTVYGDNHRAQALYRKVGFREVSRRPNWINFHGQLGDEITMVYRP